MHVGELILPSNPRWVASGAWTDQLGYSPGPQKGLELTHPSVYPSMTDWAGEKTDPVE